MPDETKTIRFRDLNEEQDAIDAAAKEEEEGGSCTISKRWNRASSSMKTAPTIDELCRSLSQATFPNLDLLGDLIDRCRDPKETVLLLFAVLKPIILS